MLSTCIRGQIMPTRNKPQKINKRVTTSPYKTNGKTTEYLLIHNLPAGEKNSLDQAAFWHEVKVLCCLLIPTAGRQDRQYVFPLNALSYFLHTIECSNDFGYCVIEIFRSYRYLIFSILFQIVKTYVMCAWIVEIRSLSPSNHPRSDDAPIVIVIQSEHLKHSISPTNRSKTSRFSIFWYKQGCHWLGAIKGMAFWSRGFSRGSPFKT